ncbi:hypothetical protein M3Y97_00011100 [Aphelenchoides bicaudatus]|nr:hypothetical protein M3Y97_00011100 [Aphelenchoides bicaudatus]
MFPKNKEAIRMEIADTLDYSLRLSSLANHTLINTENVTADGLFLSGALMIQMFEFTFGQEVFRQALILFVETHKYSSVDEFDFIRAFEKVTGNATLCGNLTIREFMLDFIDQLYYPVVAVTEVNQQIKLSQYSSNHTQSTRWNIPLFIHNINLNETHLYWLLKNGELCSNNNAPALSSRYNYIFNHNYVSFLRIHYSPKLHQNLMKEDLSKLDEVAQLGITQDFSAFENVNAGNLFLKLINDSNGRLSSQLTFFIIHHLGMKDAVFMNTNEYDLFSKLHIRQIETLLQHVVWEPSTDLRINNFNKAVLDYAITLDVGNVRKRLNDMFEEFRYNCTQKDVNLETCNQLSPNLRQSVYCAGVVANETQQMFLIAYLLALQQNLESHSYLRHEVKILEYNLYCIENLTRLVELIKMTQFQNMPDLLDQLSQQLKNVPDIYDGTSKQVMEIENTDDNEGQCEVQELFLKIFFHAIVDAWQNTNKLEETKKLAAEVRPFVNPPLLKFFDSEIEETVLFAINDSLSNARKETRWLFDAEVPETRPAWMTKRLEVNVKNITYDLLIEPHFSTNEHVIGVQKEMTIDGHVDIQFTTTAKMDQISLNSHRQMIQNIVVLIGNQTIVPTIKRDYYETFLHIEFGQTVEANTTVRISIDHVSFISAMSDGKQDGLILSKHYNPLTNSTNYLFTTQLSGGTNARTLTVCFDIPNYKAIWRVRIRHFRELVPISNAEVETSSVWSNDKMETVFKATTPIASMFFSVALGQLQSIDGVTKNGIPVSVYAPPGYQVYAQVALETSITALDYFDSILNVPYQSFSTKLDVLAFKNFYGAMENVASVVLNDHYVLYDQCSQTLAYKQQLVTKIVHELGHQWFGDLISSKYWEQMFLGESFARFLEPWFFDHIEGTGKSKRFESTEIGLRFDEQNLLPVVDTPEKTVENRLTPLLMPVFNRPAALFATLQRLLGDQAFWKAVQAYVNENKFGVAEEVDLCRAFDQAINSTNVTDWNNQLLRSKEFLDPFVKQVSFPVIFVEANKTGGIKIWQQPYHSLNESNNNSTFNYYFNLPLFLMYKNGTVTQNGWLTNNTRIFNDSNLLLVNPGRIAYARVLYDDFSWSKILANFSDFDEITRAVLLTDTYSFVKQGTLKWSRLFGLLKNLQNESSELVWSYGIEIFLNLLQKLKTQPEELNKLKALIKHAVDGRGEIRFESWSTSDANTHFVYLQNELRDPEFARHAAQFSVPIYNECLSSIHGLSECFEVIPEHRSTVLCAAIQEHEQLFEPRIRKLLVRYGQMSATDPFLRDKAQPFTEAIGCLTDSNLLRFYINATVHRMFAPFEDLILKSISQKDETQMHLYTYFIEYFQTITNSDTFDLYVSVMAFDWSTEEQLQQISEFNLPNLLTVDQQKTMNTTIQQVRRNIEWMNKNFIGKHDIL